MRLLLISSSVNANLFFHLEVREEMGKNMRNFQQKKEKFLLCSFEEDAAMIELFSLRKT